MDPQGPAISEEVDVEPGEFDVPEFRAVQIFKTWRILVNKMIDEDVPLPANVVSRIELPTTYARVKVSLSPEQVAAVGAAMGKVEPRYEILVWLAACAGFRKGEALGLKRSHIDWKQNLIYISEQRQHGKAAKLKTQASEATLPVDRYLIERLAQHVERHPRLLAISRSAVRSRQRSGYAAPPDEGLVVTNRLGGP